MRHSPNSLLTYLRTPRALWQGCFALLLAFHLVPIWLFPYVPTQDGPAHLGAAAALTALADGAPFLGSFYEAQWGLVTNQVYHRLLVTVGSLVPLPVAEKLILSAYALLLPLSVVFALRGLKGASPLAAFLAFPLVYSYVFYLGFYNYCFGLLLFVLALGLYFRLRDAPAKLPLATALALTLVATYFVHVISLASTLLALGVMAGVRVWGGSAARRTSFVTALAAVPAALLMLGFMVATERGTMPEEATAFLSVSRLLQEFFFHVPALAYKLYSPLVVHAWADVLFTLPWNLLLLGLASAAAGWCLRNRTLFRGDLLGALMVFLFIILWIPNRLGEVGWLTDRFLPYGYLLLILWLAGTPLSRLTWRYVAGAGVVLSSAFVAYRIPVHAALNADIREYTAAARVVEDGSTVLPLNLTRDPATLLSRLGAMYPNLRYDPLLHAAGYIALERRIVNLRNYQAGKGYFPLRYEDATNPMVYLSEGGLATLERPPFAFDLEAYRQQTGAEVDYLLLWGDLERERAREDVQQILAQLGDYALVYTSEPRGLMHVFRRNA